MITSHDRPLRIEFPDAWYHVMNRGRRGEAIFSSPEDFGAFVALLKDSAEQWHVSVARIAYAEPLSVKE